MAQDKISFADFVSQRQGEQEAKSTGSQSFGDFASERQTQILEDMKKRKQGASMAKETSAILEQDGVPQKKEPNAFKKLGGGIFQAFEGLGGGIAKGVENIKEKRVPAIGSVIERTAGEDNRIDPISGALQIVGNVAGGALDVAGGALGGLLGGVDKATGEGASELIKETLSRSGAEIEETIRALPLGDEAIQKAGEGADAFNQFLEEHPDLRDNIGAIVNIAEVVPAVAGSKILKESLESGAELLGKEFTIPKIGGKVDAPTELAKKLSIKPQELSRAGAELQRLHKPLPTDAEKFATQHGVQLGDYLAQRGIIANPEKTIEKLYERFNASMKKADEGFASIKGSFQSKEVGKALNELLDNERAIAKAGAASKDKKLIENLVKRHEEAGLTMSEVNTAKRLFARKVKTEYLKDSTKTGVDIQGKTNIDQNLRDWQRSQAKELGFDELAAINKETQMAKQALDAIGKRYLRSQTNNVNSLTDWIIAGNVAANPAALGLLITKKGVASESFRVALSKVLGRSVDKIDDIAVDTAKIERKSKIREGLNGLSNQ